MTRNQGHGLIEVLISASIFMLMMASANSLLTHVLLRVHEIGKLRFNLRQTIELTERSHLQSKLITTGE